MRLRLDGNVGLDMDLAILGIFSELALYLNGFKLSSPSLSPSPLAISPSARLLIGGRS